MTDPNWKGYRVYSPESPDIRSVPVTFAQAKELIWKYEDKYGEDGIDFVIQKRTWVELDYPWVDTGEDA